VQVVGLPHTCFVMFRKYKSRKQMDRLPCLGIIPAGEMT
jgi:hypothetical protein